MLSIIKWQAVISRHLVVADYLWTQSLLPFTKYSIEEGRPQWKPFLGYPYYLRMFHLH